MKRHKCCKHCHHAPHKMGHKYPCNLCIFDGFYKFWEEN